MNILNNTNGSLEDVFHTPLPWISKLLFKDVHHMYNGCFENIRLRCTDITGGFGFRRTKVRLKEIKKFRGWIDKLFQIIKLIKR